MFPGCFYLLGMWYRRQEAQKRFSLFFSSTSLAGAFGGLLASAIGKMDFMRGYRGWRWIFILEGVVTVLFGILFLFTFPSFPEEAVSFLSFPPFSLGVAVGEGGLPPLAPFHDAAK